MKRREFLTAAPAFAASALAQSSGRRLNIACVGIGNRGTAHLNNLLKVPNVSVCALCDNDPKHLEIAQATVVEAGQPKPAGFAEWKKLLERKDIDAVVAAIPVDLHSALYLDVITAGKDLYAEKPLAMTVKDCDAVVAAAHKSDRIVQVGLQRRADPHIIATVGSVHSGEIGQVIEGRVLWSNTYGPIGGWYGLRHRSGDWMVEQAVHNWDVVNWANRCRPVCAIGMGRADLFRGEPVRVDTVCNIMAVQPERDVHDYYSGVMQYENGVIVNILHSWISPDKMGEEYTRLVGTRGGVDINTGRFSYRPKLKLKAKDGVAMTNQERDMASMQAFVNSVSTRQPPVANVEHGRDAFLTCLLMREAVYRRKMVTLKELIG
jgi:predicted dehydrogenase